MKFYLIFLCDQYFNLQVEGRRIVDENFLLFPEIEQKRCGRKFNLCKTEFYCGTANVWAYAFEVNVFYCVSCSERINSIALML
jgi:hypothetical protein